MGLFNWLFGRETSPPHPESAPPDATRLPGATPPIHQAAGNSRRQKLPQPANVQPMGEDGIMVSFQQGNMSVVMDKDAFDYTYGDAEGPDPAQRDLEDLLPKVSRVCVLDSPMFRGNAMSGRLLADVSDPPAIRELARCLRIVVDPRTFGHCHCLGGPTMELYAGPELVATIGLQHGRAIRWKQWYHDAVLEDGNRLTQWLQQRGVDPEQLQAIYSRGDNFLYAQAAAPSEQQKEAHELLVQANKRAQENNYEEALQLVNRALTLTPDAADIYASRGHVLLQTGKLAEAAAEFSAAITCGFRHAEVYFMRAMALDSCGQPMQALADCSMTLNLSPGHAGAYNSRGLIRHRLGCLEEASADYGAAIGAAPDWYLPYMNRASCHHSRGDLDAALVDYDRAIALLKESPPAQPASEQDSATGTPNQVDSSGTRLMLAQLHCRRGELRFDKFHEDGAEADFVLARNHDPAAAAACLGDMWLRRHKFELAVTEYVQLIRLCPHDGQGYIGRGMAHEALKELDQAVSDYSAAIRLDPERSGGYVLRARARQQQERLDDAIADLSEHLRRHPGDSMALSYRAHLHKKCGEFASALSDLNEAHDATSNDPNACNGLAWFLATCTDDRLRDGPRAVALARAACEASKYESNCVDTLAAALAETDAFDEAIRWQAQAVDASPEEMKLPRQARLELYRAHQSYRE